ncbi:MAG: NAD(+)/NADH kinase, partial [Verrucomicrobiota bacterium]
MKVGIIANPLKEGALEALRRLREVLAGHEIEAALLDETAELAGEDGGLSGPDLAAVVDVVAVLGGDGTMLHAMATLGATDIPIAGINIGTLGFLTSCTDDEVGALADALKHGQYSISRRTLLTARVMRKDEEAVEFTALNEVTLARGQTGRLVSLSAMVNGDLLNHYRADGL